MKPLTYANGAPMHITEPWRELQQKEQGEALDDILSRWHWWRSNYRLGRGIGGGGNATNGYRASRQYDDENGALDDALEVARMKQVDFEIGELPDIQRAAIGALARSLCTGAGVWHSPRVPEERRVVVLMEARAALTVRLIAAGVLAA